MLTNRSNTHRHIINRRKFKCLVCNTLSKVKVVQNSVWFLFPRYKFFLASVTIYGEYIECRSFIQNGNSVYAL